MRKCKYHSICSDISDNCYYEHYDYLDKCIYHKEFERKAVDIYKLHGIEDERKDKPPEI